MVKKSSSNKSLDRCPSGVPGFDNLCQGGFVRNSVNAVLGGPGAGKTIFLLSFLYNGVSLYKENGLYVSFEPEMEELYKDGLSFGWDLQKLDDRSLCKFIKVSPVASISTLKDELTKIISKYDIKRVCFDPVSLLGANEGSDSKLRILIFDLASLLKKLGVTVLLANEVNSMESDANSNIEDVKTQYVKFLSDSLVEIYSSGLGGESDRAIRISKMRRTNHARGPVPLQISDKGLNVLSRKS